MKLSILSITLIVLLIAGGGNLSRAQQAVETPLPTVTPTPGPETAAELLQQILQDDACPHLCFMGIHFGETTRAELDMILKSLSVTPSKVPLNSGEYMYDFPVPAEFTPFLPPSDLSAHAIVMFGDDIAIQIWVMFPAGIPVETVRAAFGDPDRLGSSEDTLFLLAYQEERLLFSVIGVEPPYLINSVYVISPYSPYNNLDALPAIDVDVSCASFGVPPCIAPTAIPSGEGTLPPPVTAVATVDAPALLPTVTATPGSN